MKNKKTLIFALVALSAFITWMIEIKSPVNSDQVLQRLNQQIESDSLIKSYVWNRTNLSVGIIPDAINPKDYADQLCEKLHRLGGRGITVSVVDVLKLQRSGGEDWQEIGFADCRRQP